MYSEEETSSNVAFGYLAVLLAYLSVDEEARAIVANQLNGKNLQQLVGVVEEFLQYHRQIDDELDVKEGEVDLKTNFVGRLEKVAGQTYRRRMSSSVLQLGASSCICVNADTTNGL